METAHAVLKYSGFACDLALSNESSHTKIPTSPRHVEIRNPYTDSWKISKNARLAFLIILSVWLAWRLWTFTILPRFHPGRPKVYPYSVPWIGHSISFIFNADKTLDQARTYFGNTRQPFTFVLGGQNVHMITSAKDTSAVFKNPEQLIFDTYIQDMMLRFGISKQGVDTTWHSSLRKTAHVSRNGTLFKTLESTMKTQLNPGNEMMKLQETLLRKIGDNLSWDQIPDSSIRQHNPNEKVVSLLHWTQQCLLKSVTVAFYGEAIFKIEPDFLEIFSHFDDNGWKLPYRMPAFLSQNLITPKEACQRAFRKYFDLPSSERADACWMVHTIEADMRAAGLSMDDISTFLLMVYWGINTNAWKAAFWMIASTISSPTLKASIEAEIAPHTSAKPPLGPSELQAKLEKSPLLTATYNETLRFFTSSTAARDVTSDCMIGGVTLEKGSRLVIPYRQMLLDEEVFGSDASEFNPDRFFTNPALGRNASFRPYGGGLAYCPGRFLAQKEITYFNALVLSKFNVDVYDPASLFPRMNTEKPCSGVVQVASGDDLLVRVSKRVT